MNNKYKTIEEKKQAAIVNAANWRYNNLEKYLLQNARHRAKKVGLDFNLTLEDIVIPECCPYLGVKLEPIFGKGVQDYNPSVDRIDNSKGYIKGNVQVISTLANKMKRTASIELLRTFAKNILRVHSHDS